jgi:ABC-type multidrug transport system fused ATPase/permease subunit
MLKYFNEKVRRLATCQNKKLRMKTLMELVSSLSAIVVQIGIFLKSGNKVEIIIAAYFVLNNMGVTAGETIVFVQLLNYVLSPIKVLPQSLAERNAAKKLLVKIATELEQIIREEKESNVFLNKGIVIQNLSFGYEHGKEILHSINSNFELGKKYAIVGTFGSGKSTLLNLLMASYNSYNGSINYDNTEIKDINSDNQYAIESIIQQNVFIFNTTIKDHITMFQSFSDEAIANAIQMSGLKTLVEEKGMEYICGENGSGLSGGEKQRVSIARSLLRKSQVLLVDEATAALDKETAYQVSNSILNLDGVTSIVVTHSLEEAHLKQYDEILTLKNGSIVEAGTFDSLIKNKGYFYSLFTVSQ